MSPNNNSVLILGHGEMGHAMEYLLRARCELAIWERRPPAGKPITLEQAAARADVVLFCLPALPHFELATRLSPALARNSLCLSVAKGLDEDGRTAAQVFARVFGEAVAYGVLCGPMISEEILSGRAAFAEYGSPRSESFARVRNLFQDSSLALEYTPDITGISWCAVLKNVYAILFGVADGLGLGDNMRGYLATAVVRELGRIVGALGGAPATPGGLAGLGDLITTATSRGSHHHELGRRLARGERSGIEGEGVHTLATIRRRSVFDPRPYPLFQLVQRLVSEPASAATLLPEHLARLRRG
jgi:glycerol-3-phosphate dehydrogenase (NAD(P)+)